MILLYQVDYVIIVILDQYVSSVVADMLTENVYA